MSTPEPAPKKRRQSRDGSSAALEPTLSPEQSGLQSLQSTVGNRGMRQLLADSSRVDSINNEELIAALATSTGPGLDMLRGERRRRVLLGHRWLDEPWVQAPSRLIQLIPTKSGFAVVEVDASVALGAANDVQARPLLSPQQLAAFLAAHGISLIKPEPPPAQSEAEPDPAGRMAGLAVVGSKAYLRPSQLREAEAFARPLSNSWQGERAEAGLQSETSLEGLSRSDLNKGGWRDARGGGDRLHSPNERNFPIVDQVSWLEKQLISIKTSTKKTVSGRAQYFARGLADLVGGSDPELHQTMLQNLPGKPTPAEFLEQLRLAIPPDDVASFRERLSTPLETTRQGPRFRQKGLAPIFEGLLKMKPATFAEGGPSYSSLAELDAAVKNKTITQEQMNTAIQERSELIAEKIIGHNDSVAQLREDAQVRANMGSEAEARVKTVPETVAARRATAKYGVLGGHAVGVGSAVLLGTFMSVVFAALAELGEQHSNDAEWANAIKRLNNALKSGAVSGAAGTAVEFPAQALVGKMLQYSGEAVGLLKHIPRIARGVAGAAGGGAASAAAETWDLYHEQRAHSRREIVLRELRAVAIGAGSGFVAGSAVPGLGNLLGFGVGLISGLATAYALDKVIPRPEPTP